VRNAEAQAESAVETSEDPQARAYREAQSEADDKLEALDSEMSEQIKKIRAEFNAKRKAISDATKEQRNVLLKALSLSAVEDIDQDALSESYLKYYKALSNTAKLVKEDYPDLVDFVKNSVPSRFAQTPGTGNSRGGAARGWTPRFASITVNDKAVVPATLGATAKEIGIKAAEGGRKLLASKLLESIVTPDNLSTDADNPSKFSVKHNDKVFNMAVVGTVASEGDAE
jgi:hypothetical protein